VEGYLRKLFKRFESEKDRYEEVKDSQREKEKERDREDF